MLKLSLKLEFTFGVEYDREGWRLPQGITFPGMTTIRARAEELFGGFTEFQTVGGWTDPSTGATVREEGRCIVVYCENSILLQERIDAFVRTIKESLIQKSVCVCVTHCNSACL
jgi:hypothetical protein